MSKNIVALKKHCSVEPQASALWIFAASRFRRSAWGLAHVQRHCATRCYEVWSWVFVADQTKLGGALHILDRRKRAQVPGMSCSGFHLIADRAKSSGKCSAPARHPAAKIARNQAQQHSRQSGSRRRRHCKAIRGVSHPRSASRAAGEGALHKAGFAMGGRRFMFRGPLRDMRLTIKSSPT